MSLHTKTKIFIIWGQRDSVFANATFPKTLENIRFQIFRNTASFWDTNQIVSVSGFLSNVATSAEIRGSFFG